MPLVRIEMIKGKSPEYKRAVLGQVHNSLCMTLGIEDWERFQRIIEIDRDDIETSPGKSDNFTIIELTLFPGRTKKQKRAAIAEITAALSRSPGIAPEDIFIVIHEPPLENWGFGGVQKG